MALVDNGNGRPALATGKGTERREARKEGAKRSPVKNGRGTEPGTRGTARAASHATVDDGARPRAARSFDHDGAASGPKPRRATRAKGGLAFGRMFTERGKDPLEQVTWERRSSIITNPDGSVVFKMEGAEVPAGWSQLATDIVVSKYFRKAGLHGKKEVGETSVRQVVHRLSRTIREAGERFGGYFANAREADTFESELAFLLVHQYGAFNSPVWFNCGLYQRYGIEGSGGNWAWNEE